MKSSRPTAAALFFCLSVALAVAFSMGPTASHAEISARGAKAEVKHSAKDLQQAINTKKYKRARKFASPDVIRYLRGQKYSVHACGYKSKPGRYNETHYTGRQPRGCNFLGSRAGSYALGFKKVTPGRWRAVDLQELPD